MKEQDHNTKDDENIGLTDVPFSGWVSTDTLIAAGFNYAEASLTLGHPDTKSIITAYISDQLGNRPNIVVLEELILRGRGNQYQFYFDTFSGTPLGDRVESQVEEYFTSLLDVLDPKNQVAGEQLEGLIRRVVDEFPLY